MPTKKKVRTSKKNPFDYDLDSLRGEFAKPRPKEDAEGAAIADALKELVHKEVGFVVNWLPPWAKKRNLESFRYFFFDQKLVVDTFSVPEGDIDIEDDVLPERIERQIAEKVVACGNEGIAYIPVRPDAELQAGHLAAALGMINAKGKPQGEEEDGNF